MLTLEGLNFFTPSPLVGPLDAIQCPQSQCMQVLAGRPTLVCTCVGVHKRLSLISSCVFLQQFPAYLAWFGIVREMGGKWPYNCYLWDIVFRISLKHPIVLCTFCQTISSSVLIESVRFIYLTATAWKKSYFILLEKSDFYMTDNLSIAVHAFMKISLSAMRYEKLSTNFRGLPQKVDMAPSFKTHEQFYRRSCRC